MPASTTTRRMPLGLLVLAIYGTCVASSLVRHDLDPMNFVYIGSTCAEGDPSGSMGYDGQFYYYIATDLFNARAKLDIPAQRYQRILYPVLAYLFAFGSSRFISWTLIIINLAAVTLAATCLSRLSICRTRHNWYLLAFCLWVGNSFAVRRDLAESLCFALILVSIYLFEKSNVTIAAVSCSLAILAKETALPFAAGLIAYLFTQRRIVEAGRFAVLTLGPYVGLQLLLKLGIGVFGFQTPAARFEIIPFAGIAVATPFEQRLIIVFLALPFALAAVSAIWNSVSRRAVSLHALFIVFHAPLVFFLPEASYTNFPTAARVLMGAVLATFLWVTATAPRKASNALSWLWLAVSVVYLSAFFD